MFQLNLAQFKPAAQMRLALQQRSPATSLDEVLAKLNLTAHEDTKSNDLIQGYDFAANLRTDGVLVDRNKTCNPILRGANRAAVLPRGSFDTPRAQPTQSWLAQPEIHCARRQPAAVEPP